MADTTIACQICFKKIKQEALPDALCYNYSMLHPKLSKSPIKAELSIDEIPLACNECELKIDEEHQALMQNEKILGNVNLPQPFLRNSSSLVNDEDYLKNIKEEFVEVAIKNEHEDIVKEECVLFNTDMSMCVEEFTALDVLYYCYQCNYATRDKQLLTNHIFTHLSKCNLCSYITFDNSSLQTHIELHLIDTLEDDVFECHDCGYESKSRTTFKFHVLTHKKLLNFKSISYKTKNSRRRLWKYSEEKSFSCDMCNFKCHNKTLLIQHNKTHTQEKSFKCNTSDYRTNQLGNLKSHTYKQSGELPFSCDKCDYRCYYKSNLTRHNRTHIQGKPFKCSVCNFCFNRAGSLKTHMYKHTGERPFSCDKCEYRCCKKLFDTAQ